MSQYWPDFLKIALAHLLAAASPGPDFAIVLKQSLRGGRKLGVWTAWGVGAAICLHVSYSLFGLGLILRAFPQAFTVVKFAGAGYLAWIGIKALRAKPIADPESFTATEPLTVPSAAGLAKLEPAPVSYPSSSAWTAWRTGFFTNALNPKVTLCFIAIFASLVRPGTPLGIRLFYGGWVTLATGAWFTVVAFVFTHAPVRRTFLSYGVWIDRAMGIIFLTFAALLAFSSL